MVKRRLNWRSPGSGRRGFTLIELLVVIAILTLLLALLMAGLGRVRKMGAMTRETGGAAQLNMAYLTYANDNRDSLMPAYLKEEWAAPGPAQFEVRDNRVGAPMHGETIRRYPWRLAPYLEDDPRGLIFDAKLWNEVSELPDDAPEGGDGYQRAVATNPSFGLNSTYVGGDAERGGFQEAALRQNRRFYVTRASEPLFTNRLLIFTSARGASQATALTVPGWHRVDAPVVLSENGLNNAFWTVNYWDPDGPPAAYGWLDLRYFNKGLATHFDGHVEALTNRQLRDMRRWSNQADRSNWRPVP